MAESDELKKIKKEYGERFMHLCRDLFSTILEKEGLLTEILELSFDKSCRRFLYDDIISNFAESDFKNFIYNRAIETNFKRKVEEEKTPFELLDEAGYDLYECTTEEEIQEFKKYYAKGEELCTFKGKRLEKCVVFFAVRKDVDSIKREDFKFPRREDEYGTSVIGIQFEKKGVCVVSIKNRYNHKVSNPDATFGNDLDRIIPGLTQSFEKLLKERNLELDNSNIEKFSLPKYVVANDGRMYRYNMEIDQIYYCPDNVIINHGQPKRIGNPESQLLIEYFLIDIKRRNISLYESKTKDSFVDGLQDIEKIEIKKDRENETRIIIIHKKDFEKPITIEIDKYNQIIGYENESIEKIGNYFLSENKALNRLYLPNVTQVGNDFLVFNKCMQEISMENLSQVGDNFLMCNNGISSVSLPNLSVTGDCFLSDNEELKELTLEKLVKIGDKFLRYNEKISNLQLPNLRVIGDCFLYENCEFKELSLPNVMEIGDFFLNNNFFLKKLSLPNVTSIGKDFLASNMQLGKLKLLSVTSIGDRFLYDNEELEKFEAPNLSQVGDDFLYHNNNLNELNLPNLSVVGNDFLYMNNSLKKLSFPLLKSAGYLFFGTNNSVEIIDFPLLESLGDGFFINNNMLIIIELPSLVEVGALFLGKNKTIKEAILPKLESVGKDFLKKNYCLTNLYTPKLNKSVKGFLISNPVDFVGEIKRKSFDFREIAGLDKASNITTFEINSAFNEIDRSLGDEFSK